MTNYIHSENFNLSENLSPSEDHSKWFKVDKDIAATIQILNKKGFHTLFSCEGHRELLPGGEKIRTSFPYITFTSGLSDDILSSLPESWTYEEEDESIYCYIFTDNDADFEHQRRAALDEIQQWASAL